LPEVSLASSAPRTDGESNRAGGLPDSTGAVQPCTTAADFVPEPAP
jgi:hypothetical protein